MSKYIEGNKNTVFDHVNFKREQYELMEETLDKVKKIKGDGYNT